MKTEKVVYHANGENSGTYAPLCFLENFTGDINEKTHRFINWDCNIYTEVNKYILRETAMPEWMSEKSFLNYHVKLKFAAGQAGNLVYSMSRDVFVRFITLSESRQYWYGWASSKNRGAFISSLLLQFNEWLSGNSKHEYPLSHQQWECATKYCPIYKAKKISTRIYNQF
jgi:hypothetical protein